MKSPRLYRKFVACLVAVCAWCSMTGQAETYVSDGYGIIYSIDMDGCVIEQLGTSNVLMADLAISPDGQLYGVSGMDIYAINLETAEASLEVTIPSADTNLPWNSLLGDNDGSLIVTGPTGELIRYDPNSGTQEFMGNCGVFAAGDCAIINDVIYVLGITDLAESEVGLFSVPKNDISNTTLEIAGLPSGTWGLFTREYPCELVDLYVTINNNIHFANLELGVIESSCETLEMEYPLIYGAASVKIDFLNDDCIHLDLDADNSSGADGIDFQTPDSCALYIHPIVDSDVEIQSFNNLFDSARVFIYSGLLDDGSEILSLNDSSGFVVTNNNSADVWIHNTEMLGNENLSEVLATGHYNNQAESPTMGFRQIGVVSYTGAFVSDTALTHIGLFDFPDLQVSQEQVICEGDTALLEVFGEAESFVWSTGDTTQTLAATENGIYSIIGFNEFCSLSLETEIEVIPYAQINMLDTLVDCDGGPVLLWAGGNGTMQWSSGEQEAAISVAESGWYTCQTSNSCFTDKDSTFVAVLDVPDDLIPDSMTLCTGIPLTLYPTYDQGIFSWSTGDTLRELPIEEPGEYTLHLNHMGCETDDTTFIKLEEGVNADNLLIPNVISPNNDGLNEVFRPQFTRLPEQEVCSLPGVNSRIIIFNRWGEQLHEDPCHWSALRAFDEPYDSGIYYYIIQLNSCAVSNMEFEGTLHLLRQ